MKSFLFISLLNTFCSVVCMQVDPVKPPVFGFDFRALNVGVSNMVAGTEATMNISLDFTNQRVRTLSVVDPPTPYPDNLAICKPADYSMDFDAVSSKCNVTCWNGTSPSLAHHESSQRPSSNPFYTGGGCDCAVANIFADLADSKLNPSPCSSQGQSAQMWDNVMHRYCVGKDTAGKPMLLFLMTYSGQGGMFDSIATFPSSSITFGTPPVADFATPVYCLPHHDHDHAIKQTKKSNSFLSSSAKSTKRTSASKLSTNSVSHLTWPERSN